jgi:hypothetical protein
VLFLAEQRTVANAPEIVRARAGNEQSPTGLCPLRLSRRVVAYEKIGFGAHFITVEVCSLNMGFKWTRTKNFPFICFT